MKMDVTVSCCICAETYTAEITLPDGWDHRYGSTNDDKGFCPKHASIAAFAQSQCPGCVGGWGDCDMWRAFAYSGRRRNICDADYAKLEQGICPRRTNGTISMKVGDGRPVMENIDLSDRAPLESGKAFAQAIREYVAKYPAR